MSINNAKGVCTVNTKDLIQLARDHVLKGTAPMQSSAEACLADAIKAHDKTRDTLNDREIDRLYEAARTHALKSLAYTVGIGHADYIRASQDVSCAA